MRLIDADALDKALTKLRFNADGEIAHWGDRKDWCLHGSEIEKLIANAPTVDAEPVVRCKDCWYSSVIPQEMQNVGDWHCEYWCAEMHGNDFCSCGKKKERNENG